MNFAHVDEIVQENDADGARHRPHLQHLDALLHLDLLVVAADDSALCGRRGPRYTSHWLEDRRFALTARTVGRTLGLLVRGSG